MATVLIHHEDFSQFKDTWKDFDKLFQTHMNNIESFKSVVENVLSSEKGKYVFNYVPNYRQFDVETGELTKDQIKQIEIEYPNCFI